MRGVGVPIVTVEQGAHPRHRLDDLLQNAVRFSVMAALDRAGTLLSLIHI